MTVILDKVMETAVGIAVRQHIAGFGDMLHLVDDNLQTRLFFLTHTGGGGAHGIPAVVAGDAG